MDKTSITGWDWSRLKELGKNSLKSILTRKEQSGAFDPILQEILRSRHIDMVFQPVVSLDNYGILGYEALARGPQGSDYEKPLSLLAAAEHHDCRLDLETICHRSAILTAAGDLQSKHLFLNFDPRYVNYYRLQPILSYLDKNHIDPHQIVLEITERTKVDDYLSLASHLEIYRREGIRVAVDDAGAGYSSLQAMAELNPDFVKVDLSLISNIHVDTLKQVILETLTSLCHKIKAEVICEGIEQVEELCTIQELGCQYGQGYLFGIPGRLNHHHLAKLLR